MVTSDTKIKFTYRDYKYMPLPDVKRYELLKGELFMVPSPNEPHQNASRNLEFIIWQFVKERDMGMVYDAPIDVILSKEDVVQPDIIFISKERLNIITKGGIKGAPDLVIEIISPGTAGRDKTIKHTLYARYGVKEYWIANPKKKEIEVYGLGKTGFKLVRRYTSPERLCSPLLNGLEVPLSEVFS